MSDLPAVPQTAARGPRGTVLSIVIVGINYTPELTGIAPYTTTLARGLAARGHGVRVLTAMPHYPEWRRRAGYRGWSRSEMIDGVDVRRFLHMLPKRPVGLGRLLSELSFGLRVLFAPWGRADVVLFVTPALFATRLAMLRTRHGRLKGRGVVWVQDLYSQGIVESAAADPNSPAARLVTHVEAVVLKQAAAAVLIHPRFVEHAVDLGAEAGRLHVVRNWTHLAVGSVAERAAVRSRLGWRDDEVIALHSGNMGVKQGLGNLVDAAHLADRRGLPIRFVFTGGGSERAALEEKARSLGIERIGFLGTIDVEDFPGTLRAADVLLLNEAPGLRETAVPSKLTSYFSAGKPVVAATDASSLSAAEVQTSGGGVRVDPADPSGLLDEIARVMADGELAASLGRNGLRYSTDVLSERAALDDVESVLLGVAGILAGSRAR